MEQWMKDAVRVAGDSAPAPPSAIPRVPGRVVHIDADYVAYYCAGNDECDPGRARKNVLDRVESAISLSGATKAVMHLTAAGSHKGHRYNIATVKPYQGQRGGRKPRNWQYLRNFLEGYTGDAFTTKLWAEREADDGIAAYAYESINRGRPPIAIHTADKDMRMLPGFHLNWSTYQLTEVPLDSWDVVGEDGLQYGFKWFLLQMLQGDGADHIPGLEKYAGKNVGPKTAEKALAGLAFDQATSVVVAMYEDTYGDEWADRFSEQAGLLWLRQDRAASLGAWLYPFLGRDCKHLEDFKAAASRMQARVEADLTELARIQGLACRD